MKKLVIILMLLLHSTITKYSYAEYIVKLNTDITKFDNSQINYIFGDWAIVNSFDNLDVSYIQDNYTYTACEVTDKPLIITATDMSQIAIKQPKKSSTIAILDTGVDLLNDVLKAYVTKQYNTIDYSDNAQDECGHGTHIAGIITSLSNSNIMPVKVLNGNGTGKSSDIAIGIKWATDEGAKIINLSLGGTKYDQLLKESIDYAVEHGCIVVCASGNTYGERTVYPACLPNTISVGSIEKDGSISKFSNRGDSVDLYAIGNTKSFDLNGEYTERSGTSMSCAIVSAELSMLF